MLHKQNWQWVVLGAGDAKLEAQARKLQENSQTVYAWKRVTTQSSRVKFMAVQILIMPSRYEPCGISQMIAMRYGCVPLVREVGGLRDTVTDGETGFVFADAKVKSFNDAVKRALTLYPSHARWLEMQKAGMAHDFSWPISARKYFELYKKLVDQSLSPVAVGILRERLKEAQ